MRSLPCSLMLMALPLSGCAGRQTPSSVLVSAPDAELAARVDPVVDSALAQDRVVGLVLLVARDGKVVYHRAAGYADRESSRPMREDDVFRLASLTKIVVSVTALALVDQGKLGLDDPVDRWLPDFRPRLPDGTSPTITVRQLLTHTAGLNYGFAEPPNGPYHRAHVSDGLDDPALSLDENLARLASAPLLFAPGTGWAYSLSHDVLGAVVARAAGVSLAEAVARMVTEPLGLSSLGFITNPARLASPYANSSSGTHKMANLEEVPFGFSAIRFAPYGPYDRTVYFSGGGGMVGNAGDYLRFLEALRLGGGPLLSPSSGALLSGNKVGNLAEARLGPGTGFSFGFAVMDDPARAHSPLSRGSWQWGGVYGNTWWIDHASRTTVVLLTNTALEGMAGRLPEDLRRAIHAAGPG